MLKALNPLLITSIFIFLSLSNVCIAEDEDLAIRQIQLFSQVFHQIKQHYVKPMSDEQLMQHAITGMLNQLDPHTTWLSKEAYADLQEATEGEFAGIGIEVIADGDYLRVITPIDNSPAQKAGILANDVIIAIDKQTLKGLLYSESIELLRGEVDTLVTLQIQRESEKKPLQFKLKRQQIKVDSVKGVILGQNIAYLRLAQFQKSTARETQEQLEQLSQQAEGKLSGIILDLRNNPGGILSSAVSIVDLFIPQGLIVYTEGQIENQREQYFASGQAPFATTPLIIIINQGSASASEIVAGALQDHQRAMVIGQQSFGKGSVQTVVPLPDLQAIKMTTALYYTPLGRSIQAKGISPDIELEQATRTASEKKALSEKQLAHHITNDAPPADNDVFNKKLRLHNDFTINEALKLMKAMQFSQKATP